VIHVFFNKKPLRVEEFCVKRPDTLFFRNHSTSRHSGHDKADLEKVLTVDGEKGVFFTVILVSRSGMVETPRLRDEGRSVIVFEMGIADTRHLNLTHKSNLNMFAFKRQSPLSDTKGK
jgi:hypothetical protein